MTLISLTTLIARANATLDSLLELRHRCNGVPAHDIDIRLASPPRCAMQSWPAPRPAFRCGCASSPRTQRAPPAIDATHRVFAPGDVYRVIHWSIQHRTDTALGAAEIALTQHWQGPARCAPTFAQCGITDNFTIANENHLQL